MQKIHEAFIFTELLFLAWLGLLEAKKDESGTFRLEDYAYWLENHTIHLVNYVSEVGTKVLIPSPITPAPVGIRWFSLNMDGELPHSKEREVSMGTARYLEKFQKTYNISWHNVFKYDELGRWLRILNVRLEYADVFQVYVEENKMARTGQTGDETFGVDITFMTFEKHECDFTSKPPNPKKGDVLILNCSVIVNGLWNASLVFRNDFDGSETRGQVSQCGRQPSIGSRICSTVKVKAATTIFAYSCLLEFPSGGRHGPIDPMFKHSKWTDEFNKKVVCNLPKIYLQSIPSDVTFLCNRKPCEDTALVDDTVTCVAPGYPEPIFDLRIQHLSAGRENKSQDGDIELNNPEMIRFMRNTAEKARTRRHVKADIKTVTIDKIKVSENYQISRKNVGQVQITCNTSNALGSGYKALVLEVKSQHEDNITDTERSDVEPAAASGEFQPYGGLTMLCNGRTCKDKGIMRFGDEIACHYDQNKIGGKLTFILKIDGYEKTVAPPCIYTLRTADVGKKFVQCIGYIDSSISVLEAHVFVACAFRYPQGDPHRTEDYDDTVESAAAGSEIGLVILCNDVPCNRPGRIIHSKVTYVTCRYTDQRVSSLTLMVNGAVMFKQTPENTTEGFLKLPDPGDLSVKCFDSLDNNVAVTINIKVTDWPCEVDEDEDNDDSNYRPPDEGAEDQNRIAEATTSQRPGAAAGNLDVSNVRDAGHFPIEIEPEKSIGTCGQESVVLLELLFVFIGMFVGHVQF